MILTLQSSANVTLAWGNVGFGPIIITGANDPIVQSLNLASGNNTFTTPTSPTGWVGVLVVPPPANAIVIKYKTTSGDTGVNISQNSPSLFRFDTANVPTTVYLNAASLTTGITLVIFF